MNREFSQAQFPHLIWFFIETWMSVALARMGV